MEERGIEQRIEILNRAKRVKDDEFYTRMEDIEAELAMYPTKIWKDKVVFCNCDDAVGERRDYADTSAFALYFLKHFLGLSLKNSFAPIMADLWIYLIQEQDLEAIFSLERA